MGSNAELKAEVRVPLTKEEIREKVLSPYQYIADLPSKRIRDKLQNCFNFWFNVPKDISEYVAEIGHMMHNASLVIDDIQDSSDMRRGVPSAHIKYGIPLAINAGNLAYFLVLQEIMHSDRLDDDALRMKFVDLYSEGMVEAHDGQGMDIYWRDNLKENNLKTEVPTLQEYEDIMCKKTCAIFVFGTKAAQIYSEIEDMKKVDFTNVMKNIGLYFQIKDDILNLMSDDYSALKGFCEDITEGKLSYPVITCLNNEKVEFERKLRLFQILSMHTQDVDLKKEALGILKNSGALDASRRRLDVIKTEILEFCETLPENPLLEETLADALFFD